MIRQLKSRIKKHGINKVAFDLGYRSTSTLYNWLRENKVPNYAKSKVQNYLKETK